MVREGEKNDTERERDRWIDTERDRKRDRQIDRDRERKGDK